MAYIYNGLGANTDNSSTVGKKMIAFGTSITEFCSRYSGGYLSEIKRITGVDSIVNAGHAGIALVDTVNGNGIYKKIITTDVTPYDIVTIESTTNDFKLNVPIGTVGVMGDTNFDVTTYAGALRYAIEYILTNKVDMQIVLLIDTQRDNDGYDVNYTNSAGHKLIDYVNATIAVAELYALPYVDWYHWSGITAKTFTEYTLDSLHPNAAGYKVMGRIAGNIINLMCK